MTSQRISPHTDVLDSRDVIERIANLELDKSELDEDEILELAELRQLQDECVRHPNWEDGVTLIADDYFIEYTQELAEDLGYVERQVSWPYTCIDWDRAARELQYDYFTVEFYGQRYWVR